MADKISQANTTEQKALCAIPQSSTIWQALEKIIDNCTLSIQTTLH